MNSQNHSTIRNAWRSDWSAVRSHSKPLFFESPTFSAAITALQLRDSRMSRLMMRTLPHNIDAAWIIHARCGQYAINSMRRAS